MDLTEATALVSGLEHTLGQESSYRATLEQLIADLMEAVYQFKDQQEKVKLSAMEYRAPLIRERWKLRGVN